MRKGLEYVLVEVFEDGKQSAIKGNYKAKRLGDIITISLFDNVIAIIRPSIRKVELTHAGHYTRTTQTALNAMSNYFHYFNYMCVWVD